MVQLAGEQVGRVWFSGDAYSHQVYAAKGEDGTRNPANHGAGVCHLCQAGRYHEDENARHRTDQ